MASAHGGDRGEAYRRLAEQLARELHELNERLGELRQGKDEPR